MEELKDSPVVNLYDFLQESLASHNKEVYNMAKDIIINTVFVGWIESKLNELKLNGSNKQIRDLKNHKELALCCNSELFKKLGL